MIQNYRYFNSNHRNDEFIERLVSKIARGQFQIETFQRERDRGGEEARITIRIQGFSSPGEDRPYSIGRKQTQSPSDSGSRTSLTPGEKKVQKQVANCYM